MKLINPKFLGLVQFVVLFLLYWLLGLAFWPFALGSQADLTQTMVIRFLGSLVYYPTTMGFGFAVTIFTVIFLGCGLVVLKQPVKDLKSFTSFTIFIEFLFHYFFWDFSFKYARLFAETIQSEFIFQTVLRFSLLIVAFVGLRLLQIRMQKKQLDQIPVTILHFECPNCHTQYVSNVKFCLKCNQFITIVEKKVSE